MESEVMQLNMDEELTFEELHGMLKTSKSPFHQYCASLLTECLEACGGGKHQVKRFLETHDLRAINSTTDTISSFTTYDKEYRDKVAATLLACFEQAK